jgi:hypothetical protein
MDTINEKGSSDERTCSSNVDAPRRSRLLEVYTSTNGLPEMLECWRLYSGDKVADEALLIGQQMPPELAYRSRQVQIDDVRRDIALQKGLGGARMRSMKRTRLAILLSVVQRHIARSDSRASRRHLC